MIKKIVILGSTGSIGQNALRVIENYPEKFNILGLAAKSNIELLLIQIKKFQPGFVVIEDQTLLNPLQIELKKANLFCNLFTGQQGLSQIATLPEADIIIAGIVGAQGLSSTLAAAAKGKRILLANKEALVMGGKLLVETVNKHQAELIPLDSEHNAIFQCLPHHQIPSLVNLDISHLVKKIILTASGGPFLNTPLNELASVSVDQALQHPTWKMGKKISIDSATMMNKALEIIEAHYLFKLLPDQIKTIIHPQSRVHSLIEYHDGSTVAQMAHSDMRVPIASALGWPHRLHSGVENIMLSNEPLNFQPMDYSRFPCLPLAYEVLSSETTAPTILNAANEIAVEAFLSRQIKFVQIYAIIRETLDHVPVTSSFQLEAIFETDRQARIYAKNYVNKLKNKV